MKHHHLKNKVTWGLQGDLQTSNSRGPRMM